MEQVAVSKCDICKEDIAKVFCYECHQFLCQSCKSFHEKFPATKRHTITDSHNIDRSTLIHKLVCEHHNIEFTYYCRDCECLICSQCVTSEHTGHTITNIAEVAGKAREDVKKRLKHIKDNVKTLSDLIEDFKTTKQADIETGTDNFIKEVNKVSQDLIRIIESIAKINVTNASDFLVFEKQQLLYNVAKLEKSHSEYSSIQERYEQILRDKHDVTFFLNHKSLAKEFELLDDIYHPEEPKEVEPLKTDVFLDSVNERIESKYDLSYRRKTERKEKRVASTQKNSGKRQTVNLCPVDEESIHSKMVSVAIEIGNEESEYALSLVNS
ncbi:transcription intermediary factor 1-beta-like, partial [Mytilus trossulus]|uniref:transcription intermediary factor 1-beta-like n=1 Tax=Mytilus trossulus TaxID=6551 RepID=UPI0030053533